MRNQRLIEGMGIGLSVLFACIATWLMLKPASADTLPDVTHIDKLVHFVTFFLIALPAVIVRPQAWLGIALAASVLGGAIEIIQPWFGRTRELADFAADMLGAFAAVPVGRWLSERWQLKHWKRSEKDL